MEPPRTGAGTADKGHPPLTLGEGGVRVYQQMDPSDVEGDMQSPDYDTPTPTPSAAAAPTAAPVRPLPGSLIERHLKRLQPRKTANPGRKHRFRSGNKLPARKENEKYSSCH